MSLIGSGPFEADTMQNAQEEETMINYLSQAARRPFVETGVPGVTSSPIWGENGMARTSSRSRPALAFRFTTMKVGKRSSCCRARSASVNSWYRRAIT